jgi:hypothetical protein
MRSALVLAYFLVSARLALGQDSSAFAAASPTPYPPVYPIVVQPAQFPPAIIAQPLSITALAALPPEQISLAVQSASHAGLLAIIATALANPVALVSIMQSADAPAKAAILTTVASTPTQAVQLITDLSNAGTLATTLSSVSVTTLYSLLQSVSKSPLTAQLFVSALTAPQRIAVTNQIIAQLQSLSVVDTESNDADIMLAMAQFATLDPRFRAIGNWSYYGQQLKQIRDKIAAEGMTPDNKAAMIAIYQNAATALKDFQAREKNP